MAKVIRSLSGTSSLLVTQRRIDRTSYPYSVAGHEPLTRKPPSHRPVIVRFQDAASHSEQIHHRRRTCRHRALPQVPALVPGQVQPACLNLQQYPRPRIRCWIQTYQVSRRMAARCIPCSSTTCDLSKASWTPRSTTLSGSSPWSTLRRWGADLPPISQTDTGGRHPIRIINLRWTTTNDKMLTRGTGINPWPHHQFPRTRSSPATTTNITQHQALCITRLIIPHKSPCTIPQHMVLGNQLRRQAPLRRNPTSWRTRWTIAGLRLGTQLLRRIRTIRIGVFLPAHHSTLLPRVRRRGTARCTTTTNRLLKCSRISCPANPSAIPRTSRRRRRRSLQRLEPPLRTRSPRSSRSRQAGTVSRRRGPRSCNISSPRRLLSSDSLFSNGEDDQGSPPNAVLPIRPIFPALRHASALVYLTSPPTPLHPRFLERFHPMSLSRRSLESSHLP